MSLNLNLLRIKCHRSMDFNLNSSWAISLLFSAVRRILSVKMGKKKELSSERRAQIEILAKEGFSQRQIAAKLNICQATVHQTVKRISDTGGYMSRKRCVRPRCTNQRTDALIRRMVVKSPGISSKEIRSNLEELQVVPSRRTIRHRLNVDLQLKTYRPVKKPLLSRKNIVDRLALAQRYANWTADDWAKVMFSDECMISQLRVGRTLIRRQ